MEGRERLKKEGDHSRLFDVGFNKQGNLKELSWEASKIGKSPHSPIRRVKVCIIEALIRFSHTLLMVSTTHCSIKDIAFIINVGKHSKDNGVDEELPIVLVQL